MNVKIKKVTFEQSVIEVETRSGIKIISIDKTGSGHSWDDFTDWDITDQQYYDLEEVVDGVMRQMEGTSSLNVTYELE